MRRHALRSWQGHEVPQRCALQQMAGWKTVVAMKRQELRHQRSDPNDHIDRMQLERLGTRHKDTQKKSRGGDSYRLFVYVEAQWQQGHLKSMMPQGTTNGDDGVLAPAVVFTVPVTNSFLSQPVVVDDLVSPDGFQLTPLWLRRSKAALWRRFQASEPEGAVWAMVVANIHEVWVDPNAIKAF